MIRSHRFTIVRLAGLASASIFLALVAGGGCRGNSGQGEVLPGRSRPLVRSDWPHPREYAFAASDFRPPDPESALLQTPEGIRAYVVADPADPLVRITAALSLGRLHERAGEIGASHLLARFLTGGASMPSTRSLAHRLDALGAELMVEELPDATRWFVEVLAPDWQEGLNLILDQLQKAPLDDEAIRRYRTGSGYAATTSGVSGQGFRPRVELERILRGYPLAPPDPGIAVDPSAVKALASRIVRPDRIVLGVGGQVTKSQVEAVLAGREGSWPREGRESEEIRTTRPPPPAPSVHAIDVASLEGWVALGREAGPLPESEKAPLAVLADVLNTRLNIATREIRGLSNRTVFVLPDTADGAGLFHVDTGGRPEAVAPLIHFTREEMLRLARPDGAITREELEMAKGALILGDWQKSLDGARQASATFALEAVRYGGTRRLMAWPAAVEAVTAEDAGSLAEKYLNPAEMATVVVGPMQRIREARHPRWPVDFGAIESGSRPTP